MKATDRCSDTLISGGWPETARIRVEWTWVWVFSSYRGCEVRLNHMAIQERSQEEGEGARETSSLARGTQAAYSAGECPVL